MGIAAERWERELQAWAIPPEILAAAPESPWGFSPALFARRADAAITQTTPSNSAALEALPPGGTVLDVGCGGGAASLPLAAVAGTLIGVDPSAELLAEFELRATATGSSVQIIHGAWPEGAGRVPMADVVVCNHVAYNVPNLIPFFQTLTAHARRRVVLELTRRHPLSDSSDLWLRFHGLVRPTQPTADTVVDILILREIGLEPERVDWVAPDSGPAGGFAESAELIAWTRRRLCLPATRDPEIAAALVERAADEAGRWRLPPREITTLWWDGAAS